MPLLGAVRPEIAEALLPVTPAGPVGDVKEEPHAVEPEVLSLPSAWIRGRRGQGLRGHRLVSAMAGMVAQATTTVSADDCSSPALWSARRSRVTSTSTLR